MVTISARSWFQGGLGSITTVSIFSLCNQRNTPSEVKTTTLFLQCVPHPNLPRLSNSQHHHAQSPSLVSMATLSLLLWCFTGSLDHSWELGAYLYVTLAPFNQAKQSLANGEVLGMYQKMFCSTVNFQQLSQLKRTVPPPPPTSPPSISRHQRLLEDHSLPLNSRWVKGLPCCLLRKMQNSHLLFSTWQLVLELL